MNLLLITRTLADFPEEAAKVREISKLGVNVSLVVPARWRGTPVEPRRLASSDYELLLRECCFAGWQSRRIRFHLHFYPGLSKDVRNGKWDIVHVDEEPMNLATYHALRKCRTGNPRAIFTTWQNLMKRYPPPFEFFERRVFEDAAGCLAGNREAEEILRRRGFEKPVACVPQHGVDPSVFRKVDSGDLRRKARLDAAFVIGFVGQIAHRKGIDALIRAFAMLPRDCALVLIGAGPDSKKFKSLAEDLRVSARVRWVPWVDQREIVKYMCAFDVLVLPSRTVRDWKEQFGRVLIEAMSCETPVVGSDSGDIPNVIGDAGLLFHENDETELASCLARLMDDPSLRRALGRCGRERVIERFSYAKVAQRNVEFYRRICCSA